MPTQPTIIYTKTDEAPLLATYSFLPIIEAFTKPAGLAVELRDISLAGRILAAFADRQPPDRKTADALAELGALTLRPEANIIKLPNISASVPQLKGAIAELQQQGFALPDYPETPSNTEEQDTKARYDKVKGSAVNPVLREGNSDRRAPKAVKDYARKHPHQMGAWSADSRTRVATMAAHDFRANEQSVTLPAATTAKIEFLPAAGGAPVVLKDGLKLPAGEVLDATFMSKQALLAFLEQQIAAARELGVLFSLHLKATMMKVSDPILFGHAVRVFLADFIQKHAATLEKLGVDFNNGLGDLVAKMEKLPAAEKAALAADLAAALAAQPPLAMVNSDKGITNLHVPSDVIIDASMPAMIREGGKMWDRQGKTRDTLAVIPDSSYAGVYQAVIDFCRTHGALDPRSMGSVPNVGLMAQKAEEYGSHDKTFEIPSFGTVRIVDSEGRNLLEHAVEPGDIWRACQTKDAPVRDWVKLAVTRARASGTPAVFWLDARRAHDAALIEKVNAYLKEHDTAGLDLRILPPAEACAFSLERIARGLDTISVTGNVLRDYLTDLFPILELATSAKMLSIVKLMKGGGLFETGAGGSAPKHVQDLISTGHLRWDSLGEFCALGESFKFLGESRNMPTAKILGEAAEIATQGVLDNDRSPGRKAGQPDNRHSHYWFARYWAEALAAQSEDTELAASFAPLAKALADGEAAIVSELLEAQKKPVDLGGYYNADPEKRASVLRPSPTLNAIIG